MKKIIFIWIVAIFISAFLAVYFCFPTKARAEGPAIDYQKQAVIFLCDENSEMAQVIDSIIGINLVFFETGTIVLPTSHFFIAIKEMVIKGKQDGYEEILVELYKENAKLKFVLKQIILKAEKK